MKSSGAVKLRRRRNSALCAFFENVAKQKAPSVRQAIEPLLRKLERQGIKNRTSLKKHLDHLNDKELCTAVWILGQVGDQNDVPKLLKIRRLRPKAAFDAIEALANVGGTRPRKEIVRSLNDRTELIKLRIEACHALGHRWRGEVPASIFYPIVNDKTEDAGLRGYAIEAIGLRARRGGRTEVNKARAVIVPCLDDPAPEVRFWAIFAVAQVGIPQALAKLRELARNDHAEGPFGWSVAEEAKDVIYCLTHDGRWPRVDASERRVRAALNSR